MKHTIIRPIPFYFIRHGQTDWNIKNMIQGHTDIPLNEVGIKQAQDAAPFLSDKNLTRIITSPLMRAHKTAHIISEILQIPLYVHEGLKERFLGELEGTVKKDHAHASAEANYMQHAPGGEPIDDFKGRLVKTLDEILDENEMTLIVAHGGVYWALTDMLGFENQKSSNAIPYLFKPQEELLEPEGKKIWHISSIAEHSLIIEQKKT